MHTLDFMFITFFDDCFVVLFVFAVPETIPALVRREQFADSGASWTSPQQRQPRGGKGSATTGF